MYIDEMSNDDGDFLEDFAGDAFQPANDVISMKNLMMWLMMIFLVKLVALRKTLIRKLE